MDDEVAKTMVNRFIEKTCEGQNGCGLTTLAIYTYVFRNFVCVLSEA